MEAIGPEVTEVSPGDRVAYAMARGSYAEYAVVPAAQLVKIPNHVDFVRPTSGRFAENMTVCLESLIGEEGGRECIKLETQVLVTATGAERLDTFPFEET